MFKFKNWRKKEKISPINVLAGDTIEITYHKDYMDGDGSAIKSEKTLIKTAIGRVMVVDEVGIFDADIDGRDAVGGIIISKK